jgi:hypothetical protein
VRIESVTARAFGPFTDRTLEFADGMTVVVGPNEAGKSSWHAALRLAITGVRRGKGAGTKEERAVSDRHRPWDRQDAWEVEARLRLADGRRIEIRQDLAGKVDCRAVDLDLGRDVSDEIMDGTPDASRWLGLDRDSFAATVSVAQAQIQAIAGEGAADLLQDQMQRAAATRGTDATAAEALERLADFRRTHVGADMTTARGPLRTARTGLADAEARAAEAHRMHDLDLADQRLDETRGRGLTLDAAIARLDADEADRRATRAGELSRLHPSQPPPATARDDRSARIAAAIGAWRHRPETVSLTGPDAAELERQIAALPVPEPGDRRPHPSVIEARRALDAAAEGLRLAVPLSPAPSPRPGGLWPALVVGGGLLMGGLVALAADLGLLGVALIASGVLVCAAGLMIGGGRRASAPAGMAPASIGLDDATPSGRHAAAIVALGGAIVARGERVGAAPVAAYDAYVAACERRGLLADEAAGGEALRQALVSRRASEAAAAHASAERARAEADLRAIAEAEGIDPGTPDLAAMCATLEARLAQAAADRAAAERAAAEWQELQMLLDGRSLAELAADATRRRSLAENLSGDAVAWHPSGGTRDQLEAARGTLASELVDAERAAASLRGELSALRARIPDVAEADEALAAARTELDRVQGLAGVLDETARILRAAEERVHRNLAPMLADAVRRWLPAVSEGAYTDVSVDPADLRVTVKESSSGRWREAQLLSEGTREQVYLLLRVAMAQHLVTPGEVAPLLLDEVTVQSDAGRRRALLEMLLALSRERQVILFSHDEQVAAWAAKSLKPPREALIRLPGAGSVIGLPVGPTAGSVA